MRAEVDYLESCDVDSDHEDYSEYDEDLARLAQQDHEAYIKKQIDRIIEVDLWSTGILLKTTHKEIEDFILNPQRVLGWKRLDTRPMYETLDFKKVRYLAQLLHEIMDDDVDANIALDQWLFRQWRKNFFDRPRV